MKKCCSNCYWNSTVDRYCPRICIKVDPDYVCDSHETTRTRRARIIEENNYRKAEEVGK